MQTAPQAFHDMAQNSVIPLDWGLRISFEKAFDSDVTFFTLNSSVLNGIDILAPSDDNPIQEWDYYEYLPYDDRVVSMEWVREVDFPYSVHSAMADMTINNYDDYFTPNSTSPIQQYIRPKRPMRIYSGFKTITTLPQFVGMTQDMPEIDDDSKIASFHALDFLSEMYTMPLTKTIAMSNATTDEVLDELFKQFGLSSSQYSLAKGRNKIPFVFFDRDSNAGEAFRKLMEAEMGNLWLDEQGIIRFDQRLQASQDAVMSFDEHNIISIKTTGDDEIINTVRINSDIREVQAFQPIWSKTPTSGTSDLRVVPAGGTLEITADLQDPLLSAVAPTIGRSSNVSWFTATLPDGTEIGSGVTVTASEIRTNSFVMTFSNTNGFDIEINEAEVWGEPAKVVDTIRYEAQDSESYEKYGEKVLDINNDYFGNLSNCDSFAEYVLDGYKDYSGVIELEVKGDPSLQLGDIISVDYKTYINDYKTIKISNQLRDNNYICSIKARHYTPRDWFVLDQSILNGTDVLAP